MGVPPLAHSLDAPKSVTRPCIAFSYYVVSLEESKEKRQIKTLTILLSGKDEERLRGTTFMRSCFTA